MFHSKGGKGKQNESPHQLSPRKEDKEEGDKSGHSSCDHLSQLGLSQALSEKTDTVGTLVACFPVQVC